MLGLDLLVQRRTGAVRRVTAEGWEGAINLPKLSEELYRSARWLRVYTAKRIELDPAAIVNLACAARTEIAARLDGRLLKGV